MKVKFDESNSGGSWWLTRKQYESLMANGWSYEPSEWDIERGHDKNPFLGMEDDDVPYGWRHNLTGEFDSLRSAVESFEAATGEDFFAQGCGCCGAPFSVSSGTQYLSGEDAVRSRPW